MEDTAVSSQFGNTANFTSLLTFWQDHVTLTVHTKLSRWRIDCAIEDKVRQILFFFFCFFVCLFFFSHVIRSF